MAFGQSSSASGFESLSLGPVSKALADGSVALGAGSVVKADEPMDQGGQ